MPEPTEHTCGGSADGPCGHMSDCALHNGPAMEPGPCDCKENPDA